MLRNINLNSSDWCDLVFEGKNKSYGAYEMRQTSSKRHLIAFSMVVLFTAIIVLIPSLVEAVKKDHMNLGNIDEVFTLSNMTNVEEQLPEENIIKQELAPPPPKIKETLKYTPPLITEDENVQEGEEMVSQDDLNEKRNVQISRYTVEGSTDADAIALEDLKENKLIVQDTEQPPIIVAEQMPQFPGGTSELMRYIAANLKYPVPAVENRIEGRVMIRFVVKKDGSVSNVQVIKGIDVLCDKEAVRVVNSMPDWIPGMQNGHPVAVYFSLPIVFRLRS